MSEYDHEPVPGLPGRLPPGERILWQGSPSPAALARSAFHIRLVAAYFAILSGWSLVGGSGLGGVAATVVAGLAGVGVLLVIARAAARSTIYTLTDRRIVLRIGIAVPKCINLPLTAIASVGLNVRRDGTGDLPLALLGVPRLGWLTLWPHARPWRIVRPQPMLRAVPDAEGVAAMIARACLAANPDGQLAATPARPATLPAFAEAQAA